MAPPNISLEHVTNPPDSLADEAAEIFASFMQEDPLAHALIAGDRSKIIQLARAMMRPLVRGHGDLYTARDENDVLVGFAFWTLPGEADLATEEQRQMGFMDLLKTLPPECIAWQQEVFGKAFPLFLDEVTGVKSTIMNTFWCDFAFVRQEYQRKGIMTALFDMVYKKAKGSGAQMALFTMSEHNVSIYKHLGFEYKGMNVFHTPWSEWLCYVVTRKTDE